MRFEITGQWKNGFEQDGILYCAQRMEEMLMHYTSHLYKVPVLNSFLLCEEYLRTYDDVKEGTIDSSHLTNILEEFIDTFTNDIVIKDKFTHIEIQQYVSKLKGNSLPEQRKMMYYLYHIMSSYPVWAANSLRTATKSPKEKKKIENALRSYLPMIVGIGYHPTYIYWYCKQVFKNTEICDDSCLERFLNSFDGSDNEYIVYFAVDKRVKEFEPILEKRLGISFELDECSKKLKFDYDKYICLNMHTSALSPWCPPWCPPSPWCLTP